VSVGTTAVVTLNSQPAPPAVSLGEGQPAAEEQAALLRIIDQSDLQGVLQALLGDLARVFGL
jgi:hypothetical protein